METGLKKVLVVLLSGMMCVMLMVNGFACWRDCETFDVYVPEYFEGSEYEYCVLSTYDDYEDDFYYYCFEYCEDEDAFVSLEIEEYFGRVYLDDGTYTAASPEEYWSMFEEISYDYNNFIRIGGYPAVILSDDLCEDYMALSFVVNANDYFYLIRLYGDSELSDAYYEIYDNIWGMDFYGDSSYYEDDYEENYEEDYEGDYGTANSSSSSSSSGASLSSGTNNVAVNNNNNTYTTARPIAEKPTREKTSVPNQQEKLEKAQTTETATAESTTSSVTEVTVQVTESATVVESVTEQAQAQPVAKNGILIAIVAVAGIAAVILTVVFIVLVAKKKNKSLER